MKKRLILIGALVALLAIPMVVNAAVEKYRYDNTQASVFWTQQTAKNGMVTWVFGYASVYQFDSQFDNGVYGDVYIDIAKCPVGTEPWSGWDENGEPLPDPCTYSSRWGFTDNASIEIIGKKLDSARMSGTFNLYNGDTGASMGTKVLTAQLTGIGGTWTSQGMWRDRYQGGMSMYKDRWNQREATVTGSFGNTSFASATDSGGWFGVSSGFSLWKSK